MTQLSKSNGYHQRLLQYIVDYHPYMQDDKQEMIAFIIQRSELANAAYIQESNEGRNVFECEDTAYEILFAGLEFSPVTYLIEVYTDMFGIEISKEDACKIYKNEEVKKLFEKYGTGIEGDDNEYLFMEELKPYFALL
jgi:hypothetical protein